MAHSSDITLLTFSWEKIENDIATLAETIRASGFVPDVLLGITRGGLVPLGLLARELGIRNIASITAQSYDGVSQGELSITNAPDADLSGKNILVVDELADSGVTLVKIQKYLADKYQPKEIRTAVGYVKKGTCATYPDYYTEEIPDDANYWLYFPWEEKPEIDGGAGETGE